MANQNIPTPPSKLRWRNAEPVVEKKKSIVLSFSQITSNDPYQNAFEVVVPIYGKYLFKINKGEEISTEKLIEKFREHLILCLLDPKSENRDNNAKTLLNVFNTTEDKPKGMIWHNPNR